MKYTTEDTTTDTTTSYPNHINPNLVCNESIIDFYKEDVDFHTVSISSHSSRAQPDIDLDSKEANFVYPSAGDEDELKEASDIFKEAIEVLNAHSLRTPPTHSAQHEAEQAEAHDIVKAHKTSISSYVAEACRYAAVSLTNTAFTMFSKVKNNIPLSAYITHDPIDPDAYSELGDIEDNTPNDLADSKTSFQNNSRGRK